MNIEELIPEGCWGGFFVVFKEFHKGILVLKATFLCYFLKRLIGIDEAGFNIQKAALDNSRFSIIAKLTLKQPCHMVGAYAEMLCHLGDGQGGVAVCSYILVYLIGSAIAHPRLFAAFKEKLRKSKLGQSF